MSVLAKLKLFLVGRRAAAAVEKEWSMGFDARKNIKKGVMSYLITAGGVALAAVIAWASDPASTEAALKAAGLSAPLVAALAPAITALVRMAANYRKHG